MSTPASLRDPALTVNGRLLAMLRRLLPVLLVLIAVVMLLWVALDRDLDKAWVANPDSDATFGILIATLICGAGIGALAMLMMVRRLARQVSSPRVAPDARVTITPAPQDRPHDIAQMAGQARFEAGLESVGLWHQDSEGRYRLATQALAALPVPALLLQRSAPAGGKTRQDGPWQLVWGNHALGALTERSHQELQQIDPGRWLVCAPPEGHAERGRLARSGGGPILRSLLEQMSGARTEGLIIDRYGRRHPVQVTLEPLADNAAMELTLIIVDNLRPTLDKLLIERQRDLEQNQALEKRTIETEMATRELEAFSHSISHDLRHPVNLVDGFARILQEDYSHLLDQAGRDHVVRILNASHRMNAMIDALLETHRISAQDVVPNPVDLSSLAAGIADELRDRDPKIRSKIDIEPDMACRGDRVLLRMLVWNLFENAWKYSARSRCREIRFDSVRVHDSRVFRIRDNGIGFDMQFADQIFALFHRLHGNNEFSGSGVGLATVQRIVRRHRGRIWVESEPGKGSTFFFTLWDD